MRKSEGDLNYIGAVCAELQKMANTGGHKMLAHLLAMARLEAEQSDPGSLPTIYRSDRHADASEHRNCKQPAMA